MNRVPRPPQSIGADMLRWAREVNEFLAAREEISSPNTLLSRTTRGAARSALSGGDGGLAELPDILQWNALTDYQENDLAFCNIVDEVDDGALGGLYQAINAVAGDAGNNHPAIDTTNWRMIARAHWPKFTLRTGNKRIRIDSGRDGGAAPSLVITQDATNASADSVSISIADIPSGAGNKIIKLQETTGRDDATGTCKTCVLLRSDWY